MENRVFGKFQNEQPMLNKNKEDELCKKVVLLANHGRKFFVMGMWAFYTLFVTASAFAIKYLAASFVTISVVDVLKAYAIVSILYLGVKLFPLR